MNKRHRIIKLLIVLAAVVFLGYQYYAGVYAAISTESAVYLSHTVGVDSVGTLIRKEKLVTSDYDGTVHFLLTNGEKIAKGGAIASIYESDKASSAASRISEIDEQLELIADIEGYNDSTAVDVSTINDKISQHLNTFVYETQIGNFGNVKNTVSDLLTMMTRKQVATGVQNNFEALKNSLTSERAELASQMGSEKHRIISDTSGYFVTNADGFENVFNCDDIEKITPEYLSAAKESEVPDNVIGKIVYDYEWYLAVPVSINDATQYKQDQTLTIKTDTVSSPRLSATISDINLSENGDDAVIIFRCNEMNSELASMRSAAITIINNEYEGIKVNSKAIRISDGVTGVYVVSGLEAKFVETEIIYSDNDYKICTLNTADSGRLRLYDEIIVKGKNLYDGKIIY